MPLKIWSLLIERLTWHHCLVFLPLQTWQSQLSLWSSAKMRGNCQRKLLTSCVPCDKVSQTLPGTASVDSRRGEAESARGARQQLQCSYERCRARWRYAEKNRGGAEKSRIFQNPCTEIIAECNCWCCTQRTIPSSYSRHLSPRLPPSLSPSLSLFLILPIKCSQTVLHCSCASHSAVASVKP